MRAASRSSTGLHSIGPVLELGDLVERVLEEEAQIGRYHVLVECDAHPRHNVASSNRNYDAELAQQPAQRIDACGPGGKVLGAHPLQGGDGLLIDGLHRDAVDLLVALRFE
jgi:hypothetical protein